MATVFTTRLLSGRARKLMVLGLALVAFYLLALTPIRTYWEQRQEMSAASARYDTLEAANEDLRKEAEALQQDERVSQLARERYELVPPNAKAYAVMPPAAATVPQVEEPQSASTWDKVRDGITFWD